MEYSKENLSVYYNGSLLKTSLYYSATGFKFRINKKNRAYFLDFADYPFYVRIFENPEDFFAEFKDEMPKGFNSFTFFRTKERAKEYLNIVRDNDSNVTAYISEVCDSNRVAHKIIKFGY